MLKIKYHSSFKSDYKRIKKRGYDTNLLKEVIIMLSEERKLPEAYCDHNLTGNFKGFRECHITPDWLLVYKTDKKELILYLTRTGTHSDIF